MSNLYRCEFHVHTKYSHDSLLNLFYLKLMCKLKKINCVAITDHNEINGALKYQEKLENSGIKVIVGEEIFTKDGEIVGLFLTKKINPGLSAKETIELIRQQNGLVYVPHPYDEYRRKTVLKEECIKEYKDKIDLIEIYNGRNRDEFTTKQQELIAKKYSLRKIIGSDAHTFFELGRNIIYLENVSKNQILHSIDNGIFHRKNCILYAHTWTKIARAIKLVRKGNFHELYRIIIKKCRKRK